MPLHAPGAPGAPGAARHATGAVAAAAAAAALIAAVVVVCVLTLRNSHGAHNASRRCRLREAPGGACIGVRHCDALAEGVCEVYAGAPCASPASEWVLRADGRVWHASTRTTLLPDIAGAARTTRGPAGAVRADVDSASGSPHARALWSADPTPGSGAEGALHVDGDRVVWVPAAHGARARTRPLFIDESLTAIPRTATPDPASRLLAPHLHAWGIAPRPAR